MNRKYRFGPFVLSEDEKILLRNSRTVPLAPKVLDTLTALVVQRGRVVTRAALLEAVWPDSFVEEASLTRNISILRKMLSDDFPETSPIETVSKVGYRFNAGLEVEEGDAPPQPPAESAASSVETHAADLTPEAKRSGIRGLIGAACLLFILAIGAFVWKWRQSVPRLDEPYQFKQVTFNQSEDHVSAVAVSPDGKWIAYADADGVRLKMPRQSDSRPVQTPPVRVIDRLAWFSDQQHIALSGVSQESDTPGIWILSTTGGKPVLLQQGMRHAIPAPFGTGVAFTDATGSSVWCMEDLSHAPHRILQGADGDSFPVIAWSPNGKTLLVDRRPSATRIEASAHSTQSNTGAAYLAVDTDTGKITATVDNLRMDDAVASPSGLLFYTREEPGALGFWTVRINPETGALLGAPQRKQVTTKDVRSFTMSAAGSIAAIIRTVVPRIAVGRFHFDQPRITDIEPLSFSTNESFPHAWTVDSSSLYFEEQEGDHYRLFRQKVGTHDAVALTPTPSDQAFPLITPDNRFLLFIGRDKKPQPWKFYRLALSGGVAEPVNMGGATGEMRCPIHASSCFLRVSKQQQVVFSQLDPISGPGPAMLSLPLSAENNGAWSISPDGTKLALADSDAQHPQITVADLITKTRQVIPAATASPIWNLTWAIGGKGWFLSTRTTTGSDLYYLGLTGKTTLLRQIPSGSWIVPAPDGQQVAFIDQHVDSNVWMVFK